MSVLYVTYYRVSTVRQGRSGLGLDAQRQAVTDFLAGVNGEVVSEFTEVESGKRADRPALTKALAACQMHRALLVVAKLDRLARDAHFLLGLKGAGVEFVCCDMPAANRLTVGIMAMVAEEEAEMISRRTKAALASAKARGATLGTPGNLTPAARQRGAQRASQAHTEAADRYAALPAPTIADVKTAGATSNTAVARALNERNIPTRRGGTWTATQVRRVLDRYSEQRSR